MRPAVAEPNSQSRHGRAAVNHTCQRASVAAAEAPGEGVSMGSPVLHKQQTYRLTENRSSEVTDSVYPRRFSDF